MLYFLLLLIPILVVTWFSFTSKKDSAEGAGDSNRTSPQEGEEEAPFGPGNQPSWEQKDVLIQPVEYRKHLPEMLNMEDVVHDGAWTFGTYQGGHYAFWSDEEGRRLELRFYGIHDCDLEDLPKLAEVENLMNSNELWTIYHDINYDAPEGKRVVVSFRYTFAMYDMSLQQVGDTLKKVLPHAFVVRENFKNLLREINNANPDLPEFHQDKLFTAQMDFIRNRARMDLPFTAPGQELETTPESSWQVRDIITRSLIGTQGCLNSMTLVVDGKAETITDLQQIQQFNIRDYVVERFDGKNLNSIILRLDFEHQDLLIHMRKAPGCTDKTLFYDISSLRSSCGEDGGGVGSTSMGEICLADTNEDYWEAKYMVDDAMDKWNSGRHNELTDEQRMVVDCVHPTCRTDLYWAQKYYNKKCYAQSLFYFNRVFKHLQKQLPGADKSTQDLYGFVALAMGRIYMDLAMFEQAYYYLQIARVEGYGAIDLGFCMLYLEDPGVLDYIRDMLRSVTEEMQSEEGAGDETLLTIHVHANRLLISALINKGSFFEAKSLLLDMKAQDYDTEFVEEKLAEVEEKIAERKQ